LTKYYISMILFYFFSSRRRHTISKRDWSSDVCSSDLHVLMTLLSPASFIASIFLSKLLSANGPFLSERAISYLLVLFNVFTISRSEERRVGKECRFGRRR